MFYNPTLTSTNKKRYMQYLCLIVTIDIVLETILTIGAIVPYIIYGEDILSLAFAPMTLYNIVGIYVNFIIIIPFCNEMNICEVLVAIVMPYSALAWYKSRTSLSEEKEMTDV